MKTVVRISVICLCLLYSSHSKAQLAAGAEIAVTTSSVKITDIDNQFTDVVKGNGIMGLQGGLFLHVAFGPIYVKPKLLLDYQGGTLSYTADGIDQSVKFNAGKVIVPVLIGYKILPPVLSLEGGPVYNHLLFSTKDFNGNRINLEQGGLGYRIGMNISLSRLNLTVSYQGIKNSGSATSTASYQTPDQLIFGVGIEF